MSAATVGGGEGTASGAEAAEGGEAGEPGVSLYEGIDQDGIAYGPRVKSWEGWPDDVRETLRAWNRSGALSFLWSQRVFQCPECARYVDNRGTTACRLGDETVCDDCIVAKARSVA